MKKEILGTVGQKSRRFPVLGPVPPPPKSPRSPTPAWTPPPTPPPLLSKLRPCKSFNPPTNVSSVTFSSWGLYILGPKQTCFSPPPPGEDDLDHWSAQGWEDLAHPLQPPHPPPPHPKQNECFRTKKVFTLLFEHDALSPQMTLHLSYWVGWLILEGSSSQVQVNWEQLHSMEQLRIGDKNTF